VSSLDTFIGDGDGGDKSDITAFTRKCGSAGVSLAFLSEVDAGSREEDALIQSSLLIQLEAKKLSNGTD
jgi:hypothetical protein